MPHARNILVFAREAGAANYICDRIDWLNRREAQSPKRRVHSKRNLSLRTTFRILAEGSAACATFKSRGYDAKDVTSKIRGLRRTALVRMADEFLHSDVFSEIWISATPGHNLEKGLVEAGRQAQVKSISFLDHYWNTWQRFCDPVSMRKWAAVPDQVVAFDSRAKRRLVELSCPCVVTTWTPDRLRKQMMGRRGSQATSRASSSLSKSRRSALQSELGLGAVASALSPYYVFISENLFGESRKWRWEEAKETDYRVAVKELADFILSGKSAAKILVVKTHPAEVRNWPKILGKRRMKVVRLVGRTQNLALILQNAAAVLGFNSMLLLESKRMMNRRTFVFSSAKLTGNTGLLKNLFPRELGIFRVQAAAK